MNARTRVLVVLVALCFAGRPAPAFYQWQPSPLCDMPLVVIRPGAFAGTDAAATLVADAGAAFSGQALPVAAAVVAPFNIRYGGTYALWIRAGQPIGPPAGLQAEILRDGEVVLGGLFHDGPGSVEVGGREGYRAYVQTALRNAPAGAAVADINVAAAYHQQNTTQPGSEERDATDHLADELLDELRKPSGENWVKLQRIDPQTGSGFSWWKIGGASLAPGRYELRIRPASGAAPGGPALVDAAFLTSYAKLVYPFIGDVAAPRASYVRFRVDKLPKAGLTIAASITTYQIPFMGTPLAYLNPSGISVTTRESHRETGYTPWYCLQDIEHAPAVNHGRPVHFYLTLGADPQSGEVRGATQFASYPFRDTVVREIDWQEPAGLQVSMLLDFEAHPEKLRTFRDHAREQYEVALAACGEQVFPLTRRGLYLETNGGGPPGAVDYVVKTMRLLGFNLTDTPDPVPMRKRYGWDTFSGNAGLRLLSLPFDPGKTRREFDEIYRDLRDPALREYYEGVPVFQMVDEPYEMKRDEMSSPLWRYVERPGDEPKWIDYPGSSALHTRTTNLFDCVLEGMIEKRGALIEFRVATDDAREPRRFAYWRVGTVLPDNNPANLLTGKFGLGDTPVESFTRTAADIAARPTAFKVVYEGGQAALFLNDTILSQHDGLPPKGGFGITGDAKAVWALRIRPVGAQDHIRPPEQGGRLAAMTGEPDVSDDALIDDLLRSAEGLPGGSTEEEQQARPLQAVVEQDWQVGGGMPEAHAGFRRWAAAQGLAPGLFGKASWDDVRMITLTNLVDSAGDARAFYWSRRYSGFLTPAMFALAQDGIRANAPNPNMLSYVGLSCGNLVFNDSTPMDMFQLASYTNGLLAGISDWFSYSTESPQGNAFSAAFFNAGARREDGRRASIGMMHCVRPSVFRTYTVLANEVKYITFYNFGPQFANGDNWSEWTWCYDASAQLNNRAAQIDDLLVPGRMRSSRVALLYSMSSEYWGRTGGFKDKRAAFLALSHEYYQPELVNEDHVAAGALDRYDALYVMDACVATPARERIAEWVRAGGLLWACGPAATRNEYDEPEDLLAGLAALHRSFPVKPAAAPGAPPKRIVLPVEGEAEFRPHPVVTAEMPASVRWDGSRVRARYEDGQPAWLEGTAGKGRVVYLAHRAGATYGSKVIRYFHMDDLAEENYWADTGRAPLTVPLRDAGVGRELTLSEPLIMASALSSEGGTVVVLYNMRPHAVSNVEFRLKEPARPFSVQCFDGFTRVDVESQYADGWLTGRLPLLTGGQMVIVRRGKAAADTRFENLEKQTRAQLESTDAETLSAGAYFAGFQPQWRLGEKLVPLLANARWEVRRQAVESLGRLGHMPAAPVIVKMLEREPDAHCRGDALIALARMKAPETEALCLEAVTNRHWFVRSQALRAARIAVCGPEDEASADDGTDAGPFAERMIEAGLLETDPRLRDELIGLLGRIDSARTFAGAVSAEQTDANDLPAWARALAGNETAFGKYLEQDLPGGDGLLLAIARVRRQPRLAQALAARLDGITKDNATAWAEAMALQRDVALSREALAQRKRLPREFTAHLAYILNYTFDARLGSDIDDWEAWLHEQSGRR